MIEWRFATHPRIFAVGRRCLWYRRVDDSAVHGLEHYQTIPSILRLDEGFEPARWSRMAQAGSAGRLID